MEKNVLVVVILIFVITFGRTEAQMLKEESYKKGSFKNTEPRIPDEVETSDLKRYSAQIRSDRDDVTRLRAEHKSIRKMERRAKAENKAVVKVHQQELKRKNKVYRELPKRKHARFYSIGTENRRRS